MGLGRNRRCGAAWALAAALGFTGCGTVKVSYEPPARAHQPQTDMPPATRQALREAARGSEDQLALAAIKLAEAGAGTPPSIAAYAAEVRPASAGFLRSTMMAMFPAQAEEIAIAVAAALPSSQSLAPPPRATGHTFFYLP